MNKMTGSDRMTTRDTPMTPLCEVDVLVTSVDYVVRVLYATDVG